MLRALLNLLKGAPKAIANKSFVNLADDGVRMAGNVKFPSAISSKINSPLKSLHLGGLGSTAVSTPRINQIPNVVIPKPSVPSYAPVGVKDAQNAKASFFSKWGMQSAPAPSMNISSMGGSSVAPIVNNKSWQRKAGEAVLKYGALPLITADAVTSLLPGASNQIAREGKIDGQYQLGPSPVKNIMKWANVGYDDTSLNKKREDILESELGTRANAYGVDLSALTESSNDAINFALEEGKRKTFRKEEKRAIDDEHRRNSAIALAQLQNQMDIAGLNQTTALRGIDLQEKRYERESREDSLKHVLALLALMKAD